MTPPFRLPAPTTRGRAAARPIGFAFAALAVLASTACGKHDDATTAASATPASAPVAMAANQPLNAGWVYIWTAGDAGWTFAHDLGKREVETEYGRLVKTTIVEKVSEGPDAERVIRDLAAQGNQLIFATSFGYMEPMLKVAAEYPNVKFEHAAGHKLAPNVGVYDAKFYEPAYLAGIVAGKMTKTNTIGFVASFPIPEVLRNIDAFTLGAQVSNPDVKTKVVWVSTWSDPPKEGDAAQSLIDAGADVLLQNTDSTAVLQTAQKNGKYAFGWDSDMSAFAQKAHLASAVVNWGGMYKKQVADVRAGTWKSERLVWGVKEGLTDFIKLSDEIPAETKAKVEAVKAALRAGTFDVFTGPLVDVDGKERLASGVIGDLAWRDKVDFYVKGVEGHLPGR